jgi:hypothetical protein
MLGNDLGRTPSHEIIACQEEERNVIDISYNWHDDLRYEVKRRQDVKQDGDNHALQPERHAGIAP